MEENVNEALGLVNSETPIAPKKEVQEVKIVDNSAEKTLATIANIVLLLGIIGTLICIFTLTFIDVPKSGYHYRTEKAFSPSGFATTVMVLFSTLISWSVMKVLSNISLTLKDLNSKVKGEQITPGTSHVTNNVRPTGVSEEQRITDLKSLVESGDLTQDEFNELIREKNK